MPYIARDFTSDSGRAREKKNIDILVAISNDGWFMHSAELEQHLAAAVYRAVENRIAIARSVNTGASALIDPNGHIRTRARLSPEKSAKLPRLRSALKEALSRAEALDGAAGEAATYANSVNAVRQILTTELRAAATDLGPEFSFIYERLSALLSNTLGATPEDRRKGVEVLLDQIMEDVATVDRWTTWPQTAPSYCVDEARCDTRMTLYSRWGDWFAQAAVSLMVMTLLDWLLRRMRGVSAPGESRTAHSSDSK